jgi:alkylated DNA repair dioxygenase AlkB
LPDLLLTDNQRHEQRYCQQFVLPDAKLWLWRQWLPAARSQLIMQQLSTELCWQQPQIRMFGKAVTIPRQQVWMGEPHCSYRYSGVLFHPEPWHPLVLKLTGWVNRQLNRQFNSVLLNLYRQGDEHMGWHSDDEPELGSMPEIASLSLGQTRRFELRHQQLGHQLNIDLADGDLLLMGGECQGYWQHRVPKQSKVDSARMNFTFREIKNTP